MRLSDYKHAHRGTPCLIVACGPSAHGLTVPDGVFAIGITDCERHIDPESEVHYLVVTDDTRRFLTDAPTEAAGRMRLATISRTNAVLFCHEHQAANWRDCARGTDVVTFRQGADLGVERCDGESLHYGKTSVHQALLLAEHMGASRIGLIGVDLDGHPNIEWRKDEVIQHLADLTQAIQERGTPVRNLAVISDVPPWAMKRQSMSAWLREVGDGSRT